MLVRLRRLGSFALLLVLIGGGLGLPLFDAVAFHARPLTRQPVSLDRPGAPPSHVQVCVLEQPGLISPSIGSGGHVEPAALPAATVAVAPATTLAVTHDPRFLPRPRAPPFA